MCVGEGGCTDHVSKFHSIIWLLFVLHSRSGSVLLYLCASIGNLYIKNRHPVYFYFLLYSSSVVQLMTFSKQLKPK